MKIHEDCLCRMGVTLIADPQRRRRWQALDSHRKTLSKELLSPSGSVKLILSGRGEQVCRSPAGRPS
jgi:hypothetical protein